MNARRLIYLTARREVRERLRSRAFLVSTGLSVLAVVLIVVVASLNSGGDERYTVGVVGPQAQATIEQARQGQEAIGVELEVRALSDEAAARRAVEDDDVDAALTDGRILSRGEPAPELLALLQEANRQTAGERALRDAGLSAEEAQSALNPPPLALEELGEASGAGIAFLASLLLYIAILGLGYMVSGGVVEEKATRVVEVILAAIRPVHLLAGKVLGIGLLGLLQVLVIVGAGLIAAIALDRVELPDSTALTAALILVYFLLGYLLYACAFAVAGAMVSRQEDANSTTAPLMIVLVGAYLIGISASESPDSGVAVVATLIPPLAPMVVPARAAQDALPAGELVLSIALMIAASALLLWLAARIYDRAVLRIGAPLRLTQALALARGRE
ncbi:MAG TPA: ABC transporter permease [Solirubrobacterales bacterium]